MFWVLLQKSKEDGQVPGNASTCTCNSEEKDETDINNRLTEYRTNQFALLLSMLDKQNKLLLYGQATLPW